MFGEWAPSFTGNQVETPSVRGEVIGNSAILLVVADVFRGITNIVPSVDSIAGIFSIRSLRLLAHGPVVAVLEATIAK